MTTVEFRIAFAAPFRVSTGHARPGVDAGIDRDTPLPATSLKGLMRATAGQLLGEKHPLVAAVFGSVHAPSPWSWSDATPAGDGWRKPVIASRVRIGEDHVADHDMLGSAEVTQAAAATFSITQCGHLTDEALALHRALLAVAGQATRSLGANRRRGLGWVHITCTSDPPTEDTVRTLLAQGPAQGPAT
ncbi:RAMP superfamily CRISPR-associated protein [Actinophytocola sp. KF-1]